MNIYRGTFLIAFTTLGLEIALTRLLSVTTWYHLAFFAISTAMLGMTAGATTVYLRPQWFSESRFEHSAATACLAYAVATPVSLVMLCVLPLKLTASAMSVLTLMLATVFCALPFYCSGIAISAVLTRHRLPIGKLYASDLAGAALGCVAVLAAVELLDVPSLILLFASIGVLAAWSFSAGSRRSRATRWVFGTLALMVVANATGPFGIAPMVVKGKLEDPSDLIYQKWNSFSRIAVHQGGWSVPQLWGASPRMKPQPPVIQYAMNVDGDAGTTIRRFHSVGDIDHLKYDATNVAYFLRPEGGACIIGVGGGRDVHSALLFGHRRVVGVEVNPVFIDLLEGRFRDFARLAGDPRVELVVDEARSHLTHSQESFSVIQMSLIDTWAATGAGAFSLTENALYTVDAWQVFLSRLDESGILTVSRWYSPEDLGETGRIASLAVASLLETGVRHPQRHLAMLTSGRISTTLVARSEFSDADIATLREVSSRLGYELVVAPDARPEHPLLAGIVAAGSLAQLHDAVADAPFDYQPPTDDNPYFFNMLRLDRLAEAFHSGPGIARGNLTATLTLLVLVACLALLALATVVLPLTLGSRREATRGGAPIAWSGALYFSLIGAGFMFVEIALIQRLSVFLGHPVYALGVLLFTVIASTGCGSYVSERLPLTRPVWCWSLPPAMAIAILAMGQALPLLLARFATSSMSLRITVSVISIFPLGLLMGLFFPGGMRLARLSRTGDTPWYWALNGVFGVLCSALAVLVSIYVGISTNFLIAAACYAPLALCASRMRRSARRETPGLRPADGEQSYSSSPERLAS